MILQYFFDNNNNKCLGRRFLSFPSNHLANYIGYTYIEEMGTTYLRLVMMDENVHHIGIATT